jgi:hypothetical protein
LIKDKRFVLVGRGIYALSEWGYKTGVVRDVIKEMIKKNRCQEEKRNVKRRLKSKFV